MQKNYTFLKRLLLNQISFKNHRTIDLSKNIKIDLIITIDIPTKQFILFKNLIDYRRLFKQRDLSVQKIYNECIAEIIHQEKFNHQRTANQILRNQEDTIQIYEDNQFELKRVAFQDLQFHNKIRLKGINVQKHIQEVIFQASSKDNLFFLTYNLLIYQLQKKLGFQTFSEIIQNKIFVFLTIPQENILKIASQFSIRKELDYLQVDFFFNQPLTFQGRAFQFHSQVNEEMKKIKKNLNRFTFIKDPKNKHKKKGIHVLNKQISKQYIERVFYRKMHCLRKDQYLYRQKSLSQWQSSRYKQYQNEFRLFILKLSQSELRINHNELNYLKSIFRSKTNQKSLNIYRNIKKMRLVYHKKLKLMKKYGYPLMDQLIAHTEFFITPNNKKFSDKISSLLLFKPIKVSATGELSLFNTLQRIRLAYLMINKYLYIYQLNEIGYEFLCVHDLYQKQGKYNQNFKQYLKMTQIQLIKQQSWISQDMMLNIKQKNQSNIQDPLQQIEQQKSLQQIWTYKFWSLDIRAIRNYYGQITAFYFMFLAHIITYLIILLPFALFGYFIDYFYILSTTQYYFQLLYYAVYSTICLIWYIYLKINWEIKQINFLNDYSQQNPQTTILRNYKGPFIRNLVSDRINSFPFERPIFQRILIALIYLLIISVVLLQIPIYYGIRKFILAINIDYQTGGKISFLVNLNFFIPILIFFLANKIIYQFGIKKIFYIITLKIENHQSKQNLKKSFQIKKILFLICLQIIGPIDIIFVQSINSDLCLNMSCYSSYLLYIQSRYIYFVLQLLYFLCKELYKFVRYKYRINKSQSLETSQKYKYKQFLKFIVKQYQKETFQKKNQYIWLVLVHIVLFSLVYPIVVLVLILNLLFFYYYERNRLLRFCKRQIDYFTKIHSVEYILDIIFYLFVFINCWIIIYILQIIQFLFGHLLNFTQIVRYIIIVFCIAIFALIKYLLELSHIQKNTSKLLIKRKKRMINEKINNYNKSAPKEQRLRNSEPLRHIGRVHNQGQLQKMKGL